MGAIPDHSDAAGSTKIEPLPEPAPLCRQLRERGQSAVVTNGHFDLLHVGHLRYLQQARAMGGCLIAAVNGDASTHQKKGRLRRMVPQEERAELLAGLACMDYVVIFDELAAEQVVEILEPDVYVKGADYASSQRWPEAKVVARQGGRVLTLPYTGGHSTSQLIQRIVDRFH